MSWALASLGVSAFSGLLGYNAQKKADKERKESQKQQLQLQEAEYAQKLQDRQEWNERYGSIEQNMLTYLQNLDTDEEFRKAEGNIKKTYSRQRDQLTASLADRGLDVAGGVTADVLQRSADAEAEFAIQYRDYLEKEKFNKQQQALNSNRKPNVPSTANMTNLVGSQSAANQAAYLQQGKSWGDLGEALNMGMKKWFGGDSNNNLGVTTMEGNTAVTTITADAYDNVPTEYDYLFK